MELRGNTVLVTGASGFVGGHVARRLAESVGMQVRVLVRNPSGKTVVGLNHPSIELMKGDLLNPSSLAAASVGVKLVVHAAGCTRLTTRKTAWATAVEGTYNLYRAALMAGVQRFIFLSSFSVYFGIPDTYYDEETSVVRCGDLYADAKIAAEELLLADPYKDPDVIILRVPVIYGPGSWFWTVRFIEIARHGRLFLPAGGTFAIAYIYIDNLVDAIVAAARANIVSDIYNVFDGHIMYRDLLEYYAQMAETKLRPLPLWILQAMAALVDIFQQLSGWWLPISRRYVEFMTTGYSRSPATAEKAQREFGWVPRVDFQEGMQRTQVWLQENGYLG